MYVCHNPQWTPQRLRPTNITRSPKSTTNIHTFDKQADNSERIRLNTTAILNTTTSSICSPPMYISFLLNSLFYLYYNSFTTLSFLLIPINIAFSLLSYLFHSLRPLPSPHLFSILNWVLPFHIIYVSLGAYFFPFPPLPPRFVCSLRSRAPQSLHGRFFLPHPTHPTPSLTLIRYIHNTSSLISDPNF